MSGVWSSPLSLPAAAGSFQREMGQREAGAGSSPAADEPSRVAPLPEVLLARARRAPRGLAAVGPGGRAVHNRALIAAAGAIASALERECSLAPGAAVAVCAEDPVEALAGIAGVWLAGGAPLPIDPAGPAAPRMRLLTECDVVAAVGDGPGLWAARRRGVVAVDTEMAGRSAVWFGDEASLRVRAPQVSPAQPACLVAAAGGTPLTHAQLLRACAGRLSALDEPPARVLCLDGFDAENGLLTLAWCLASDAAVVLLDEEDRRDPWAAAAAVEREGVTHLCATAAAYAPLLELETAPLAGLQRVILSGAAAPEELVEAHQAALPTTGLTLEGELIPRVPSGPVAGPKALRTPDERALAALWLEVLRLEPGSVARDDHFFKRGGDGIAAARLADRVRQRLGRVLPLPVLYRHPVLRDLARALPDLDRPQPTGRLVGRRRRDTSRRPLPAGRGLPLLPGQEGTWAMWRRDLAGAGALRLSFRVEGGVDVERLRSALSALAERHDALRVRVSAPPGRRPRQVLVPSKPVLATGEDGPLARLDPDTPPAWSARLIRVGQGEHRVELRFHPVVVDPESLHTIARELPDLYEAAGDEEGQAAATLAPAPSALEAARAARRAVEERRSSELAYWRARLEGISEEPLTLPLTRGRRGLPRRGHVKRSLSAAERRALESLAKRAEVDTTTVVLAAYLAILGRWTGRDDLLVGLTSTETIERPEGAVGRFWAPLPLRLDVRRDESLAELARRVATVAAAAVAHAALPLPELLVGLGRRSDDPPFRLAFQALDWRGLLQTGDERSPFQALVPDHPLTARDLTLTLHDLDGGLRVDAVFDASRVPTDLAEELVGQLSSVLVRAAADPRAALDAVDLRTAGARRLPGAAVQAPSGPVPDTRWSREEVLARARNAAGQRAAAPEAEQVELLVRTAHRQPAGFAEVGEVWVHDGERCSRTRMRGRFDLEGRVHLAAAG